MDALESEGPVNPVNGAEARPSNREIALIARFVGRIASPYLRGNAKAAQFFSLTS